jgi:hypothetical protein
MIEAWSRVDWLTLCCCATLRRHSTWASTALVVLAPRFLGAKRILFLEFVCNYATREERVIHDMVLLKCCFAAVYFQQAGPTYSTTTIITKDE